MPDDPKAETSEALLARLEARLAASEARVAELERAGKPPAPIKSEPSAPYDPTARATMPPSAMRDMIAAVSDRLMADLRNDALKPNPVTQSVAQLSSDHDGRVEIRGTGWSEPRPLSPPPGVPIMDRLMDMQDAIDRADLERRLARSVKKE
jgi:hypothetical protein